MKLLDNIERIGCWASGAIVVAAFFAFGALVSMLTGDGGLVAQSLGVAVVLAALGIWLGRMRMRSHPARKSPRKRSR